MMSWFRDFMISFFMVSWFRDFVILWFRDFVIYFMMSRFHDFMTSWFQGFAVAGFRYFRVNAKSAPACTTSFDFQVAQTDGFSLALRVCNAFCTVGELSMHCLFSTLSFTCEISSVTCLKTVSRCRKQVVFLLFCGCAVPPKRVTWTLALQLVFVGT